MIQRVRLAAAPAYLLLCLLLGGSPQGVWGTGLLQMLAVQPLDTARVRSEVDSLGARLNRVVGIAKETGAVLTPPGNRPVAGRQE